MQSAIAHLLAHPVTVETKPKRSKYDPRVPGKPRKVYWAEYVAERMQTDPAYRQRRYAAIKAYKQREKEKRNAGKAPKKRPAHDERNGNGEPAQSGFAAGRSAGGTGGE